jgi:hypothetical protein
MDPEGIVEAAFEAVSVQPVRALAENQESGQPGGYPSAALGQVSGRFTGPPLWREFPIRLGAARHHAVLMNGTPI